MKVPNMKNFQFSLFNRWLNHAGTGPIIAFVGPYLWSTIFGNGEWLFWKNLEALESAILWGPLLYVGVFALYELGNLCWRKGYRTGQVAGFAEHQSAAIITGREEGKNIALTVAWRLSGTDEQRNLVRSAASDLDINLPAVLGQPYMTAKLSVIQPWDHLHNRLAELAAQVRQRGKVEDFDERWDKMLREATGSAITDLEKQIQRQLDLEEKQLKSKTG